MKNDRFWILVARRLAEEATDEELEELEYLLSIDAEAPAVIEPLFALWNRVLAKSKDEGNIDKLLLRIRARENDRNIMHHT